MRINPDEKNHTFVGGDFSNIALFAGLSPEDAHFLSLKTLTRSVAKGECIVAENERVKGLYVVLEGRVKLSKTSVEGREQTLFIFEAGEPFCMSAAMEGEGFPADAVALTDGKVLMLSCEDFADLARRMPDLAVRMLAVLSGRLNQAMRLIGTLARKDMSGRLAVYLLSITTQDEDGTAIAVPPLTQRELAKLLSTTPETLSRTITSLTQRGLINHREQGFSVPDLEALRSAAG
jgi:CRP/FNR family transcriptional regulator